MTWLQQLGAKFISAHFFFWMGVWFFFVYFFSYNSPSALYVTWFSSLLLPVAMLTTYMTVYGLIPRYLLKGLYKRFALYTFYLLVCSGYAIILIIFGSFIFLSNLDVTTMPPMSRNVGFVLVLVYLVVGVVSFVSVLMANSKTAAKNKALENVLLDAQLKMKQQELHYLKKQLHPHFLFNTLNTLYGYALRQATQTPDIILKLSNLLDYSLYQTEKPNVLLSEEIEHLQEYIALEKMRFQDSLLVDFCMAGDLKSSHWQVPPMLFLPFVENAFKHGSLTEGCLKVFIRLQIDAELLCFQVRNSFVPEEETAVKPGGIGLENIRKRLELLFNGQYQLQVRQQDAAFFVQLRLPKKALSA